MSYKEIPNVKIGVTNSVHERLRNLKGKGESFNDVIVKLLPESEDTKPFDLVDVIAQAVLSKDL